MKDKETCVSAFLLAAAFFKPLYFAELVFISFVPIFYLALYKSKPNFLSGLIWGALFYGVYFVGLAELFWQRAYFSYAIPAYLFLVLYGALGVAFCFWLARVLSLNRSKMVTFVIWLCALYLLFLFHHYYFYLTFGVGEGDSLHNLLVPLAVRQQWLYFLPKFKMPILLFFVFLVNGFIALMVGNKRFIVPLILSFLPFLLGWFFYEKKRRPEWLDEVVCCVPGEQDSIFDGAGEIESLIQKAVTKYPCCSTLIFPETAFPFPLNENQKFIASWYTEPVQDSLQILVGAHYKESETLCNVAYCLQCCLITDWYVKSHRMIFTEYVPRYCNEFEWAHKMFLDNKKAFNEKNIRKDSINFFSIKGKRVQPFICSDLFFDAISFSKDADIGLSLVKDSWFSWNYIPELMFLYAKVKTMENNLPLIYCSYKKSCFIQNNGEQDELHCECL